MRKKLLSLALALVMCLSLMPSAFAAEGASVDKFTDVPADAWYREELAYAVYNGYISGTSATTFSPEGNITRGQFVTILGRMLKVDTGAYTSSKFTDVDASSWYGPYVAWAASEGYVNGTSSTTFAPGNNITVEQMGTILANYIGKSDVTLQMSSDAIGYADYASISGWARDNMELMALYNLLPVDGKGNVSPRKAATRAEAAVSLVRLAQSAGWGTAPVGGTHTTSGEYDALADAKAQSIHDELWASCAIKSSMSEKEKAVVYFRWMCENTNYGCRSFENPDVDIDFREMDYTEYPWESYRACGPLLLGKGVCEGLANAYYKLLSTEGIQSYVKKETSQGHRVGHAWNIVTLDGREYEIDLTEGTSVTKWANGSLSEVLFKANVQKQFYPDEWQAEQDRNSGFTKPTEEELQQMLDSWQ